MGSDEVVSYRGIVSSLQEQASNASPEFQYVLDCSLCLSLAVTAQGSQFAIEDFEVVTATVDLDEVVSYRGAVSSLQEQASSAPPVPIIEVDFNLCHLAEDAVMPSAPMEPRYHLPEEEIALGNPPAPVKHISQSLCSCISYPAPRSGSLARGSSSMFEYAVTRVWWHNGLVTGLACWLWEYLRCVGASSFLALPSLFSDALAPL